MKWKWLRWAKRHVDSIQSVSLLYLCNLGGSHWGATRVPLIGWIVGNNVGLYCVPCLTRLWCVLYGVRASVHGVTTLHGPEHVLMFLRRSMSWSEVDVAVLGGEAC